MSWHIYVVVKTLPIWAKLYYKPLTNRSFSQGSLMVPIGKRVPLVAKHSRSLIRLVFSSTGYMERHDIHAKI